MKYLGTDIPAEVAEALTRASRPGCLFCGHSPHTRTTELAKLTAEGANITTYVELIESKHKHTILSEILPKDWHLDLDKDIDCLFERYHHWICSIRGYFARKGEDYSFYYAYAGVPSDKRGLVYKDSPDECMQLVASILEATSKKLEPLSESKEQANAEDELFVFTLTKDGVLSRRTPISGDNPYSMKKGARRHRVLEALVSIKNHRFCPTQGLAELAECTEYKFRKTCGEIKKQICKHFQGIKSADIIDSKGRSGYRINPKARIVAVP